MPENVFHVRLGKNDQDLREMLTKVKGKERAQLIRDALRFYNNFGNEIFTMSEGIKKIVSSMEAGGSMPIALEVEGVEPYDENSDMSDHEKMIYDSIQDILNL